MPDDDPSEVPDGARRLLLGPVDSFEKLYAITALRRAGDAPQRLDVLETSTGVPVTVLTEALQALAAAGLVVQQAGRWLLAPRCDFAAIDELVETWSAKRTVVLHALTQRSLERIRASAARTFADAFALRRSDKGQRGDDDG